MIIELHLTIRTSKTIMVEHIVTACALHRKGYHEDIVKSLHARFGGTVTLEGHHHGVDIRSICWE